MPLCIKWQLVYGRHVSHLACPNRAKAVVAPTYTGHEYCQMGQQGVRTETTVLLPIDKMSTNADSNPTPAVYDVASHHGNNSEYHVQVAGHRSRLTRRRCWGTD